MTSFTDRAADDVLAERLRHKDVEGWTDEHEDTHKEGGLAAAAACYALEGLRQRVSAPRAI